MLNIIENVIDYSIVCGQYYPLVVVNIIDDKNQYRCYFFTLTFDYTRSISIPTESTLTLARTCRSTYLIGAIAFVTNGTS